MLHRARRSVDHCPSDAHRPPPLDHHPVHAHGFGRAQQTSHILGILQQIEQQEQSHFVTRLGQRQDFVERTVGVLARLQHHALVVDVTEPVQITPLCATHRHPGLLGQENDLADDARLPDTFGQQESMGLAPPGPQRFTDRVPAVEALPHPPPRSTRQAGPSGWSSTTMPSSVSRRRSASA